MTPSYRYRATLHRAIDGDTYELNVDLGFRIAARITVRLRGWNCPELRAPEGQRARHEASLLLFGGPITIETYKDQQSFARWIADVWIDDQPLGDLLAAHGLAVAALA